MSGCWIIQCYRMIGMMNWDIYLYMNKYIQNMKNAVVQTISFGHRPNQYSRYICSIPSMELWSTQVVRDALMRWVSIIRSAQVGLLNDCRRRLLDTSSLQLMIGSSGYLFKDAGELYLWILFIKGASMGPTYLSSTMGVIWDLITGFY